MFLSPYLIAGDRILLTFSWILAVLVIFYGGDSCTAGFISAASIVLAAMVIPWLRERYGNNGLRLLHILYIIPALYVLYPPAIQVGRNLHSHDFDATIISIDRFLFAGADPTRWLYQHIHIPPLSVEVLQICYYAHYLYPLILGTELFIRRKELEIERYRMLMVYGSSFSFVGNMLVPAIGPRITLHEFANLGAELPGLWLTTPMRAMLNTAEGISATMTSSVAALTVFRDAFPSGHTMLTLFTLWTAFHVRARVRWFLLPLGTGLIISTVLLRYHYVTDVLAGFVFAAFVIWTAPTVAKVLGKKF